MYPPIVYRFNSLYKRELVALFLLCSECHVAEHCRSLTLPYGAMGWSVVCDSDIYCHTHFFDPIVYNLGLVARKPVFGVSEIASFKSVSSATETS